MGCTSSAFVPTPFAELLEGRAKKVQAFGEDRDAPDNVRIILSVHMSQDSDPTAPSVGNLGSSVFDSQTQPAALPFPQGASLA